MRTQALGQSEHIDRTVGAGLGGLDGITLVMDRRGRASQIIDLVHFHKQRKSHIVTHQFGTRMGEEMAYVALAPGEKLSTHRTSLPSLISRSQRCDPRNPAPPVTNIRFIVPTLNNPLNVFRELLYDDGRFCILAAAAKPYTLQLCCTMQYRLIFFALQKGNDAAKCIDNKVCFLHDEVQSFNSLLGIFRIVM